ncbi:MULTISPECIES: hypothetical protein [unclassified Streptomyces]|uniref:hypothetical protein n=1 Tax=unclassified Streptomyces TaxID=2593676 RepID=UPI00225A34F3|nr:hypothetical protein [Streptomyces sp. NBC_01264]MCX4783878.1 hypothetical protein [Streptomyces sp. NBC_01264]
MRSEYVNPDTKAAMARAGYHGVPGRTYHSPLPDELAPWYLYEPSSGHSLAVMIESLWEPEADPNQELALAPVKLILRCPWRIEGGWIVADIPYDEVLGVISEDEDDEYSDGVTEGARGGSEQASTAMVVGQPYPGALVFPIPDNSQLLLTPTAGTLQVFLGGPGEATTNAFRDGKANFALVHSDHALLLMFRFDFPDGRPARWSDAEWVADPQEKAGYKAGVPGAPGGPFTLAVHLTDAQSGIVSVNRLITVPARFADQLRSAVAAQLKAGPNPAASLNDLDGWYRFTQRDLRNRAVADFRSTKSG